MNYIKQILRKNKGLVIIYLSIGLFNAFMVNFKTHFFQKVIDGLTEQNLLLTQLIFYGIILLTTFSMNYVDNYPGQKLEHGIFLDFKLLALQKISRIDYQEYQKIGTGKLIQRIENGANAGKGVVFDFWFRVIRDLFPTMFFSIYFICRIDKKITLFLLIGYVIVFIVTNVLLKFLYQVKEKILNNEEALNRFLVRGFMEMLVFRMARQFPCEMKKASIAKKDIVASKTKMTMIHEAFFTMFALLVACLDIGILFYAWQVKSLSIGSVVTLITLIDNAYTPIAIFNVIYVQYKLNKTAYKRFEQFLNLKNDEQLEQGIRPNHFTGEIRVKDLSFAYSERQVLNHIDLLIRKGEKIAFVGESGSGKSTLIKLLVGLLKYKDGQITLDGQPLSQIALDALYSKIIYLSQDAPVFDGTVKENMVFDRDVSKDDLLEALDKVQLISLIQSLPNGVDTQIGEKASSLSGGEKQRLALSRIWFQNSDIVILDEATSALDNLTEERVMNEVTTYLQNTTVIAIAHRLDSIKGFDRIIVFKDGDIVGMGSFDELMENNPYFEKLYHSSLD
jgi:ATP-binding cassette subfamily B protein